MPVERAPVLSSGPVAGIPVAPATFPWARLRAALILGFALAELALLGLAMLGQAAWRRRYRALCAMAHAVAVAILAAQLAYELGVASRLWLAQLQDASATLTLAATAKGVGPLAPILGGAAALIEALRLSLVRFLARHYAWGLA